MDESQANVAFTLAKAQIVFRELISDIFFIQKTCLCRQPFPGTSSFDAFQEFSTSALTTTMDMAGKAVSVVTSVFP